MDSFELNKILGAVLGTCLILLVTSFTAQALFSPKFPEKPGFEIAVKEEAGDKGGAAAAAPSEPIEKLLQRFDPDGLRQPAGNVQAKALGHVDACLKHTLTEAERLEHLHGPARNAISLSEEQRFGFLLDNPCFDFRKSRKLRG